MLNRYQLAEDGNSDCQFELAKQLLEDTDGKNHIQMSFNDHSRIE